MTGLEFDGQRCRRCDRLATAVLISLSGDPWRWWCECVNSWPVDPALAETERVAQDAELDKMWEDHRCCP